MNVHVSPAAKQDMLDIKLYITHNLGNSIAANNTLARITSELRKLQQHPTWGARLSAIVDIETDYRYLLCGNYMVFYRIAHDAVYVDRVIYGRRDYMRILFGVTGDD